MTEEAPAWTPPTNLHAVAVALVTAGRQDPTAALRYWQETFADATPADWERVNFAKDFVVGKLVQILTTVLDAGNYPPEAVEQYLQALGRIASED
jgi:hypothetical protein